MTRPSLKSCDPAESSQLSTILIVDDEPNMRFLVRVTLENEGHDVIEAHHGAAALMLLKEESPDLVITDLMMPVMGGRELIDRLRSDPLTASIPILILSANADVQTGEADAALEKPFDIDALLETLASLTTKGGTS